MKKLFRDYGPVDRTLDAISDGMLAAVDFVLTFWDRYLPFLLLIAVVWGGGYIIWEHVPSEAPGIIANRLNIELGETTTAETVHAVWVGTGLTAILCVLLASGWTLASEPRHRAKAEMVASFVQMMLVMPAGFVGILMGAEMLVAFAAGVAVACQYTRAGHRWVWVLTKPVEIAVVTAVYAAGGWVALSQGYEIPHARPINEFTVAYAVVSVLLLASAFDSFGLMLREYDTVKKTWE